MTSVICNAESVLNRAGAQYCVSADLLCDNVNDCPLGEDEATSLCYRNTTCDGRISVSTETGFVTSHNYPRNVDNNEDCTWQLVAPLGYGIELVILYLQLQTGRRGRCLDALTVWFVRTSCTCPYVVLALPVHGRCSMIASQAAVCMSVCV